MSGCGDDDALPGGLPAVCYPLHEAVVMSDEYDDLVTSFMTEVEAAAAQDPEEGEAVFLAGLGELDAEGEVLIDEIVGLYDDAIAVAPSNLPADLTKLKEGVLAGWVMLADALNEAESVPGFYAQLNYYFDDPDYTDVAYEAAAAVFRVDEYTIPECGFQLSIGQQQE